jgi:hypothetical protein
MRRDGYDSADACRQSAVPVDAATSHTAIAMRSRMDTPETLDVSALRSGANLGSDLF